MHTSAPAHLAPVAERLFGDRLPLAEQFAQLLATDGVERGLIGPREGERLWERHLINCAFISELVPAGTATIADVGSGGGLPGVVIALTNPEAKLVLIETMQRRCEWLEFVRSELSIDYEVVRARAEDMHGKRQFDVVTARAVAPLDKLARWTLPLVVHDGCLLAMKGSSAASELEKARSTIARLQGIGPEILQCGTEEVEIPTTVVRVRKAAATTPAGGNHE